MGRKVLLGRRQRKPAIAMTHSNHTQDIDTIWKQNCLQNNRNIEKHDLENRKKSYSADAIPSHSRSCPISNALFAGLLQK